MTCSTSTRTGRSHQSARIKAHTVTSEIDPKQYSSAVLRTHSRGIETYSTGQRYETRIFKHKVAILS